MPPPEQKSANPTLFGAAEPLTVADQRLVAAYLKAARTLDDLPYTPEFDSIFESLGGEAGTRTRWEVLHRLQNLRKANKLPKLGRAATPPVKVTPDEELTLSLFVQRALDADGKAGGAALGQRDQLLYDPRFAVIVTRFNAHTGRNLTPHDVWRLVAKIAK